MTQPMTPQEAIDTLTGCINSLEEWVANFFYSTIKSNKKAIEQVNKARKALTILEQNMLPEWRDIETAPKDGTVILIGSFNNANEWCASDLWHEGKWLNHAKCKSITHWMPLPAQPIQNAIKEIEK